MLVLPHRLARLHPLIHSTRMRGSESRNESVFPWPLRKYQGVWLPEFVVAGTINIQHHFLAYPTDILLSSYPKCGTTWLKALVFAAMTRAQHSFDCHPLRSLNPHNIIPFLEIEASTDQGLSQINTMKAPRLLSTHLPFQMLPESIKSGSCRVVYICREPKDAFVSGWHFYSKIKASVVGDQNVSLDKFMEMCSQDIFLAGTIWDHVLSYWNESLQAAERILILKYEEMLEAPLENLMKLAEFIGCPFSEEEIKKGVPEDIVRLCSFNSLKDTLGATSFGHVAHVPNEYFYRRGCAGDWRNHKISEEMCHKLDNITREKLQDIALNLGWLETQTSTS